MSTVLTADYPKRKRVDLINLHLKIAQNNFSLLLKRHSLLAPATKDFYPGTQLKKVTFPNIHFIRNMVDEEPRLLWMQCYHSIIMQYLFTYWFIHSFIYDS